MSVVAASRLICAGDPTDRVLKQRLESPPRRTDRLTLLSLVAAGPLSAHLRPDCGLYAASVIPDAANMKTMLEAVCLAGTPPKPFQFVNSVSNAIGFYLARELGLEGPNLFIGANDRVWDNLIRLASPDLAAGLSQALLINCDNQNAAPVVEVVLLDAVPDRGEGVDFDVLSRGCRAYSELTL